MSRRPIVNLDEHSHFGIFGLVAFESKDADKPKWAQIGIAKRILDLAFQYWRNPDAPLFTQCALCKEWSVQRPVIRREPKLSLGPR